jgi:arylsulfatase A-like enzyme
MQKPLIQLAVRWLCCAPLAFASTLSAEDKTPAADERRPNVLFLVVDDLRPELGCYGAAHVRSPHLDKLASESLLLTRAYCQVPVCGASRASLMTGILPTPGRFKTHLSRADEDAPACKTLPQVFKEADYVTLSNGKVFHEIDDSADRSWSEKPWRPKAYHEASHDPETTRMRTKGGRGRIFEMPDVPDNAYGDGQIAERSIEDLRRLKAGDKPFFLACGFLRPHLPFHAPKRYWDLYDREKIAIARNRSRPGLAPKGLQGSNEYRSYLLGGFADGSDAFHRMMRHGYFASTSYVDAQIGKVLAELDRLGLKENTIVVLWGDHGWNLGEHDFWGKHNTMRPAVNAPLMLRVPGRAGARSGALVEFLDVFPTLCELAKVPVPETVQGRSFGPLLEMPDRNFREFIYTRFMRGDCVADERFIYTRYRSGGEMLYDLEQDPGENRNVASAAGYADALARMRSRLTASEAEAKRARP